MPFSHLFLVILVVAIWGFNFIFVEFALRDLSPLFLCAVRFFLASIPAIFFVKLPAAPFRIIATYGLIMFGMQFAFLFLGMKAGMPPGLTSLLMQVQVFFSMFFAAVIIGEMPTLWQVVGALVSFTGIGLVATHLEGHMSLLGFIFIMAAAATWGVGNLITKKISNINMMGLVIWGSFIACLPMFLLAFVLEGPASMVQSYKNLTWLGGISVLYIVYMSTWVGYGVWNWLIGRHPVSKIVPFTLLVPIFGILSAMLILDEPFQRWKLVAGLLVIAGLCINLLGARFFVRKNKMMTENAK
jgi:O-acetylserine/cysteine efflux transporter